MKKSSMFKWSGLGLLAIAAAAGVFVFHANTSSSRIVLGDWMQEHRILLHNGSGEHACDCFSPIIPSFNQSNLTSTSVTYSWTCSEASTYQVTYGTTSAKGTYFPSGIGSSSPTYKSSSVTLTGLKPGTTYHIAPSSMCFSGCTRNSQAGLKKEWLNTNRSSGDWTFTTKTDVNPTTVTISGSFLTGAGKGISGVTVALSGGSTATVTTGTTGAYQFLNLAASKNYTVTPTLANYTFVPASKTYTAPTADQTVQNFVGTAKVGVLDENAAFGVPEFKVPQITAKEVSITWKTYIPATSMIEYGLTTNYGMKSGLNTEMGLDHYIQLFELREGTTYHARAISYVNDPKGTVLHSPDFTFTTPATEERIANKEQFFNEPNPCSNRTMFVYYLYQSVRSVDIDIFSLSGKRIASLACPPSTLGEGWNKVAWNLVDNGGKLLKNGLYVYKIKFKTANNELELKSSSLRVAR